MISWIYIRRKFVYFELTQYLFGFLLIQDVMNTIATTRSDQPSRNVFPNVKLFHINLNRIRRKPIFKFNKSFYRKNNNFPDSHNIVESVLSHQINVSNQIIPFDLE